ncbi:MAG TPA: UDP-glucose 4-epimerase GalE [Luteibacter sp.]|uniref:UDP-glucose 4-epimerase GalE n=1 Tax=Luteibacter sp. TaxID=1886636 RepID=UPI002C921270|nr:UDP-glucose 4-epimerase GalE [Luteibacter sp.]HVI55382.1 UDP-glucose 4-epimerase GalE [Luteibacter sp.]
MVCGGAGYIGSHMVRGLSRAGHDILVVDDLSTGHREAVGNEPLKQLSLLDGAQLDAVVKEFRPDVVFHFAALSLVGESVLDPLRYHRNNVTGTLCLLEALQRHAVKRLVFSSTAAVYGTPASAFLDESHDLRPINPYGTTKMIVEAMLAEAWRAYGLRSVSLRYFNAAGADAEGDIGESHQPETHLIPNVLRAASGETRLRVFGTDYSTPDGTCVRDFVHVNDLVSAHLLACDYLQRNDGAFRFNLGSGFGYSVKEVIEAVERVTGRAVPYDVEARREGDPGRLVASHALASRELGWTPGMSDLDTIVRTAARWHKQRRY